MFKKEPKITVSRVQLGRDYSFMYENFVILTQRGAYLLLEKSGDEVYALHLIRPTVGMVVQTMRHMAGILWHSTG
jgi:hypothetical protein